jgi:hypothetical protein
MVEKNPANLQGINGKFFEVSQENGGGVKEVCLIRTRLVLLDPQSAMGTPSPVAGEGRG